MSFPRAFCLLGLLLVSSCKTNWSFNAEGARCDEISECPNDLVCVQGVCVRKVEINTLSDACKKVVCQTPPENLCEGEVLRVFETNGTCEATSGTCTYASRTERCSNGCNGKRCLGPTDVSLTRVTNGVDFLVRDIDAIASTQGERVLVVGDSGKVALWNGSTWKPLSSGTSKKLNAVWFAHSEKAFIVGEGSTLLEFDGTEIKALNLSFLSGTQFNFVDVHGRNDTHVLVAAQDGTHLRFNGTSWSQNNPPNGTRYNLASVWVSSSGEERMVGGCGDANSPCLLFAEAFNSQWDVSLRDGAPFSAIGPSPMQATNEALVGRADGSELFRHTSASGFSSVSVPFNSQGLSITGISGTSNLSYVLTSAIQSPPARPLGQLYELNSAGAFTPKLPIRLSSSEWGGQASLSRVLGSGEWFVVDSTPFGASVVRADRLSQSLISSAEPWVGLSYSPNGTRATLNRWGDVLIDRPAGASSEWLHLPDAKGRLSAIASADSFHLLVGENGQVFRLDNRFTRLSAIPNLQLRSVCRVSDTEFHIVGNQGTWGVYDGQNLRWSPPTGSKNLNDVICLGPNDAIACGEDGTVLKTSANGIEAWPEPLPAGTPTLSRCTVGPDRTLYVAGHRVFARFRNGRWESLPAVPNPSVLVSTSDANKVLAVSEGKQVLQFDGQAWREMATAQQTLTAGGRWGEVVRLIGEHGEVWEGK